MRVSINFIKLECKIIIHEQVIIVVVFNARISWGEEDLLGIYISRASVYVNIVCFNKAVGITELF